MSVTPNRPIALFYGSSTCYTEMSAEKIAAEFGKNTVDIFNIADEPLNTSVHYTYIIFGIPTWDYGELQEDWEEIWPEFDDLDLSHATVAIYGQGDQEGYPEWFQDAMGYLYHKLIKAGATVIGQWPITGYTFEQSKALTSDKHYFVGLALDDETQFSESPERINQWCKQLKRHFPIA